MDMYIHVAQTFSETLFTSLFARAFSQVRATANNDRYRKVSEMARVRASWKLQAKKNNTANAARVRRTFANFVRASERDSSNE